MIHLSREEYQSEAKNMLMISLFRRVAHCIDVCLIKLLPLQVLYIGYLNDSKHIEH